MVQSDLQLFSEERSDPVRPEVVAGLSPRAAEKRGARLRKRLPLTLGSCATKTRARRDRNYRIPPAVALLTLVGAAVWAGVKPQLTVSPDGTGALGTLSTTGAVKQTHPFFQSLGTNGRSCGTCHDAAAGFSFTPEMAQHRFEVSGGDDPLFRPNDGSNSPTADVSTLEARRSAYSMLLTRGVLRIGLPIPAGAEFTLDSIQDPYGFASAAELSLFRRPLPAANLKFNPQVMWDGRESDGGKTLGQALATQAQNATLGHAQGAVPLQNPALAQIVQFEKGLFAAQYQDGSAGRLDQHSGKAGPARLSTQAYKAGINNPFGKAKFNKQVFTLFSAWSNLGHAPVGSAIATRESIARGQKLFNTREFKISNVAGLNDVLARPVITGTCGTCHNAPNVGTRSVAGLMDIGLDADILPILPDQPRYMLRNTATNETFLSTDPGRALITGKWADLNKFKVPGLRALAARAPYFHNGSARTLDAVVDFYVRRFGISLRPEEASDLAAFLSAL